LKRSLLQLVGLLRPAPDQLALGGQPTADARWLTVVCRVASLLCYHPPSRLTAAAALRHAYFFTEPLPAAAVTMLG
jgi:hypothetical protein